MNFSKLARSLPRTVCVCKELKGTFLQAVVKVPVFFVNNDSWPEVASDL